LAERAQSRDDDNVQHPVGYFVTTIVVAWCTFFAAAPPRARQTSHSNRSYWFGFVLNELPFLAFYWLAASTALALSEGAAVGWLGRFSLVLAAATTIGLGIVARRGLRARQAVEEALEAAGLQGELPGRLPFARILFAPFFRRRRSVERIADVAYGDESRWNVLDVYRLRSRPSGCPTLVYLHGGGFRRGRKSKEARSLLYRLASQGWLCVSANYRLTPPARFPDHLVDVKKALAWVRSDGVEYGADPNVVVVAGSSAGGNLAASAALTANDARFQPGFEDADTSVVAAVSLYGYYGNYGGSAESSPASFAHPDAPPFFVAHGDRDTIVIVEDARAFVRTLRSVSSSPVVYAELPGGQHTFDLFESLRFSSVVDGIAAFASRLR
jgi:acetyl esterase/lipase